MQLKSIKVILLFALVVCIGMASSLRAESVQDNGYKIQAPFTAQAKIRPLILAGSPAVCKANYDQCMSGCAGAAQCSNQCMVNYNGCLR